MSTRYARKLAKNQMMAAVPNNSPVDPAAAMMAKTTNTIAAMRKIPILMLCTFLYSHLLMGSRVRGTVEVGRVELPCCRHHDIRHAALTEQRVNAPSLR